MRVLITVEPHMYREALALALHQYRPDFEVRIAPTESAEEVLRSFRPHLLVRSDTDGLGPEVLAEVPFRVEVIYSDSMDVRLSADGRLTEVPTPPPRTCSGR